MLNSSSKRNPMSSFDQPFQTFSQASKSSGLSVYELRKRFHLESLPHIRCGTKVLIDMNALLEMLRDEAVKAVK